VKILQVGNWRGGGGGIEGYIRDGTRALQARGQAVAIVSDGPSEAVSREEGWPEYSIPGLTDCHSLVPPPAVRNRVGSVLAHEKPDVAYVHHFLHPGAASELLRAVPTVFFHHTHDLYCPAGSKLLQRSDRVCPYPVGVNCIVQAYRERCHSRRPLRLAQSFARVRRARRWARRVDAMVVDTRHMKERLVAEGFAADRIAVLPTPIRIPEKVTWERPPSSEPLVLFGGRLTPHKGLRCLLEAMTIGTVPYRLVVAGDGYFASQLEALAERLKLGNRVEFLGWQSREALDELYTACDLVVVPSVWPEPFGMVGPEAMAHGRPVVAFDVGGISDWLEHGRTGFLVPPAQVKALAEQIDRLLSDPVLARAMGVAGRERAIRLYGHEKHAADLCAWLEAAIERRRHRP
jgi:glycosyltransferase involved in cell wall biosynthesis